MTLAKTLPWSLLVYFTSSPLTPTMLGLNSGITHHLWGLMLGLVLDYGVQSSEVPPHTLSCLFLLLSSTGITGHGVCSSLHVVLYNMVLEMELTALCSQILRGQALPDNAPSAVCRLSVLEYRQCLRDAQAA